MLTPEGTNAEIELVYHTLEGMHKSIPNNPGDWYFSGDYPTPGGNKLVNKINKAPNKQTIQNVWNSFFLILSVGLNSTQKIIDKHVKIAIQIVKTITLHLLIN